MEKLEFIQKIGFLCYALALIDIFSYYILNINFAGIWWSPIALGLLGAFLLRKVP